MPPAGEQASKHTDLCMRGSSHANTIVTFVYTNGEFARNKSEKKNLVYVCAQMRDRGRCWVSFSGVPAAFDTGSLISPELMNQAGLPGR